VICRRCGREQPAMFSPCPECQVTADASDAAMFAYAITDGDLRAAFMAAHHAWARRYAPHLLKEWP